MRTANPSHHPCDKDKAIPNYRRNFLLGDSYFFTANLADRRLGLLTEHIALLRVAFRHVRARHPFMIEAAVILPDHLHAIGSSPEDDADFALRWRLIKSAFSHGSPRGEPISASRAGKGERRYLEHTLRDENDFTRHLDYVHFNPVKHGHAARVQAGNIPLFAAGSGSVPILKIGPATPATTRAPSAKDGCSAPCVLRSPG